VLKMSLVYDVLDRDDEKFEGADRILFQVACMLDSHFGVPFGDDQIADRIIEGIESLLGEFEID